MGSLGIAAIVFGCVFGCALLGMALRSRVPAHHLDSESRDAVKLGIGLVATMVALVLGLLTGSAKSSFDTQDAEIKQSAAEVVLLDRTLARYGPETAGIRRALAGAIAHRLAVTWPETGPIPARLDTPEASVEWVDDQIRQLAPQSDAQRALQSRAEQLCGNLLRTRWLLFLQGANAIQTPLLLMLVFWLSALFGTFGLLAPRNGTVTTVMFVAALAISGALFLILEMTNPLAGMVRDLQHAAA